MNNTLLNGFRKLMVSAIVLVIALPLKAQKDKISTAEMKLTSNELDLIDAKAAIDQAAAFETTKTSPYMYLVKGKVYQRIYNSPVSQVKELSSDAAYISASSFLDFFNSPIKKKAFELEDAKSVFLQSAVDVYNDHIRLLNEEKYEDAIRNLVTLKALLPFDDQKLLEQNNLTAGKLTYAMYAAAYSKGDTALQEKYLLELISMNYPDPKLYSTLARLYLDLDRSEEAMKIINQGLEMRPGDQNLIREKINYYISRNETSLLMAEINAVIAGDPENPDNSQYYYIRGSLYEQLKKNDSAKLSYTKALELNPDNYDANWNLGALLVNEANDLYKTIGVGGVTKASIDPKMKAFYQEAKPFLEKALSNDSYSSGEKLSLSKSLKRIYDSLGEKDKSAAMFNSIQELEGK
jgi:tetratricopeptide (TPR) repeat protein